MRLFRLPLPSEALRLRDLFWRHHGGYRIAGTDRYVAKVFLRGRDPRDGKVVPLVRLDVVLRQAQAFAVHDAEVEYVRFRT